MLPMSEVYGSSSYFMDKNLDEREEHRRGGDQGKED